MQVADVQPPWTSGRQTGDDGTSSHLTTSDTNDGFFHRPVRIASYTWAINQELYFEFNPWQRFCEDPRVINRLAHFRNLKMNLHVQVLVNGNPFYYGRAIMSYIPLANIDEFTPFRSGQQADIVEATQRPHIFIDPCKCEGGELILPYCFPKSAMCITSSDWRQMGVLQLRSMNGLRHANGSTDSVNLTILAYASEVELNTPTSRVPVDISPQGATEYGSVSFPASMIAGVAGALGDLPLIGPFARATEMAASALSSIAMMFGFSRPRLISDQATFVQHYTDVAVTNGPDSSLSLALDSKKEITVDPRVVGLAPVDEMALLSVAKRECWIDAFAWTENDATGRHLYSVDVTPLNGRLDATGNAHITPAGFITIPFQFWKGSMEIRIQVVCSAYHRGRLRAVWDPDFVVDSQNYNVNYSMLLDITESTETTFKIGWGQEYDFLKVPELFSQLGTLPRSSESRVKNPFANGRLSFYVVNPLTSPAQDKSTISVNVYTRACDDFEVAAPTDFNMRELKVAKYALRPPDSPAGVGVRPFAPSQVMVSRGSTPIRGVAAPYDASIIAYPEFQSAFTYQAYSDVKQTVTVNFNFRGDGPGASLIIKHGGERYIAFAGGGNVGSLLFDVTLEPGWNYLAMTLQADFTRAYIYSVSAYYPIDYVTAELEPAQIVPLVTDGQVVIVPHPTIPNEEFVSNENESPFTMKLPGWVSGSFVNVYMTNDTDVNDTPQLGALDGPVTPTEARIYTCIPDPSGYLTFSRPPDLLAQVPWFAQIQHITYLRDVNFVPESGIEERNTDSDEANAPESESVDVTMGPVVPVRGLTDIYFGERVTSIRQLLKRFQTCYFFDSPDGTVPGSYVLAHLHHYPSVVVAINRAGIAYTTHPSIFAYFTSAFVCMRGGMRVKILQAKPVSGAPAPITHVVSRVPYDTGLALEVTTETSSPFRYRQMRWGGTAVDYTANKPYGEFELPYYSNLRYTPARSTLARRSADYVERSIYSWEYGHLTANNLYTLNYATAEDFSLSFFLSTPTLQRR